MNNKTTKGQKRGKRIPNPDKTTYQNKQQFVNLFRGLLTCSHCGSSMNRIGVNDSKYTSMITYKCLGFNRKVCDVGGGIRWDTLERAVKELLNHTDLILKLMKDEESYEPFKLDELKGRAGDIRRRLKNIAEEIEYSGRSPELTERRLTLEGELSAVEKEIALESAREAVAVPVTSCLKEYQDKLTDKWNDREGRLRIREHLSSMIDKMVGDTKTKTVKVWFNNSKAPVSIYIMKNGFRIEDMEFLHERAPKKVMELSVKAGSLKKSNGTWTIQK